MSARAVTSTLVDTPLVLLSAQGDAEFHGPIGPLPVACLEPDIAFLIRIPAGRWIPDGVIRRPRRSFVMCGHRHFVTD